MIKKKILLVSILPIFVFSLVFAGSAEAAWWSFGRSNNTKDQIKSENSEFNQGKRDNRGTGMQRESGKGQQGESGKGQQGESGKGQQRDSFPSSLSSEAIACMKTAVEARETSIISATSAFHSSIATALDARKTALVDAWSLSSATEIKTALKSAGSSFESSQKTAAKTFESANKTAITTFKSSQKACGVSGDVNISSTSSISSSSSSI